MGIETFRLTANPRNTSRTYALYKADELCAAVRFEYAEGEAICTFSQSETSEQFPIDLERMETAASRVTPLLRERGILTVEQNITQIGLRIVAPTGFFLRDHLVDDTFVAQLKAVESRAPLHIRATLQELELLRQEFPESQIVGVSDSNFHITKPDYAWNYGLPLDDTDQFEIKRFGYHGLSVASVIRSLHNIEKLPPKVLVCHLGGDASVTAVYNGKSVDTTMGYSPLEGLVMSTHSGSVDATALIALKEALGFDDYHFQEYLNARSGLLGLCGTADMRDLLGRVTRTEDHRAHLAIRIYTFNVQKAIGQMVAALDGVDMLVFTGTIGERSAAIRERVCERLTYLDFFLDERANRQFGQPHRPVCVSRLAHSRPIYVVPANESAEMLRRMQAFDQEQH